MNKENKNQKSRIKNLRSISIGASFYTIGFVIQNGLKFVIQLILTRGLGASLYGVYSFGMTFVVFLSVLSRLGTGKALLKLIPQYDESREDQSWVIGLSYFTALSGSILIGTMMFVFAPILNNNSLNNPLFVPVFRIFALYLPLHTLSHLTVQIFRSYQQSGYQTMIGKIIDPGLQFMSIGSVLLLGYSVTGAAYATFIAGCGVILIALVTFYHNHKLTPRSPPTRSEILGFYSLSIPLTFKDIGRILYTRIDVFMVGFLLTSSSVGIYRISVALTSLLTLFLAAVNQIFPSIASRLYNSEKVGELQQLYSDVTFFVFTASILQCVLLIIYSSEILAIFGTKFIGGQNVLIILATAQLFNSIVGPCAYLLMMADHEWTIAGNQILLGISNVILNYIFIQYYGLIGAALATAITLMIINVLRLFELYHLEKIHPYTSQYWKPMFAGGITLSIAYLSRSILSGYLLLIAGGAVGTITFLVVIRILGVADEIETVKTLIN